MQAVTVAPAMIFARLMLPSTLSTLTAGSEGASASSWLALMDSKDEGVLGSGRLDQLKLKTLSLKTSQWLSCSVSLTFSSEARVCEILPVSRTST